ncbi:hypothetical protein TrST_g11935 [Triparma strigata]|uniref:Uncharacterized protein n=1 Tax=Triparma strigata TaxID=1606541 RepID=A0A9W7BRC3_9STRA|nr:hypothetical protein TrST_g11935 [Triparma strigata]
MTRISATTVTNAIPDNSRRSLIYSIASVPLAYVLTVPVSTPTANAANADISNNPSKAEIITSLRKTIDALAPLPSKLEAGEYDSVRSVLKGPGVGELWNLGASKNPVGKLAKISDDMSLLELSDELQLSLQMSDQLTYDCAFVYTQPGNGKVDIKSPQTMIRKSMKQLNDIIEQAEE